MQKSEIEQWIRDRKSTFPVSFTGEKIDDDIIKDILETAVWAPTHKETQPWRFVVFKGEGVKLFFEKQSEIYQKITPEEKISQLKIKKYAAKVEQVSHVVVVIAEHDEKDSIPELEEVVATSCVVENIYLQLNANDIGGYLSTGALCYEPLMFEFLKLKPKEKLIGFFQFGVPKKDIPFYERKRISASEKSIWIDS